MAQPRIRSRLGLLLGAAAVALSSIASSEAGGGGAPIGSGAAGRLIILPGIYNTRFHLRGFARLAAAQLPRVHVEIRTWGVPLLGLYNLRARERNRRAALQLAADITSWRRAHPEELLYVVGYSGGGGIAALAIESLPADVRVDRLVLVAAAISADYDFQSRLLPHIGEHIVNFASKKDLQVGLGTRLFGTVDGVESVSAGFDGFTAIDRDLLEWRWSREDRRVGHRGNHVSYLGRRWQQSVLLPALDPRNGADALRAAWRDSRVDAPRS